MSTTGTKPGVATQSLSKTEIKAMEKKNADLLLASFIAAQSSLNASRISDNFKKPPEAMSMLKDNYTMPPETVLCQMRQCGTKYYA